MIKTLKFSHKQAELIQNGSLTVTWRIKDDKDITVDDELEFIDKRTAKPFGKAMVTEVTIQHFSSIAQRDLAASTSLQTYYGKRLDPSTHVKTIHFSFESYEAGVVKKRQSSLLLDEVKLYADGGSRGNPGPSASGFVLIDLNDNVVKKDGFYLGITTNNQAEYRALRAGLEAAHNLGVSRVQVFMDSLLVINQMKGVFKIKNADLWPVHASIQELIKLFKEVSFTHVPRELNKLADGMVNEVLDNQAKK